MGAISVRRRNRRAVGPAAAFNWPDCWVTVVDIQQGMTTGIVLTFSQPMVTTPHTGNIPYWNFRYWDTSANTTVIVPFDTLEVASPTQQLWSMGITVTPFGPYSVGLPIEWDNFRPVNGGRVRGYAPAFGPSQSVTFSVWP